MKHLLLLAALLMLPMAATAAEQLGQKDSWWECIHFYRLGDGQDALSGRLFRTISVDGTFLGEFYQLWGPALRATWTVADASPGTKRTITELKINLPQWTTAPAGQGIYGYLFGDGKLIARVTMLDPRDAARGHGTDGASFSASADQISAQLAQSDRWHFVAMRSDGTEIFRRNLPLPDRAGRDKAFALHRAANDAAWTARRQEMLSNTPSDTLLGDGACLLSTPESRKAEEDGSIDVAGRP